MQQPKFSRWPWGALAVGAPLVAGVAAAFHFQNELALPIPPDERLWRSGGVFFGVLGAANGYLIGIAIGDLGRSVLAVPLGAAMAYGATQLLHNQIGAVVVIVGFGIIMLNAISNGVKILSGCAVTMLLMVVLMTVVAHDGAASTNTHLIMVYPLVCSVITASMPLDPSLLGVFGAFLVGARASLYGMIAGVVGYCLGMTFMKLVEVTMPGGLAMDLVDQRGIFSMVVGAAASNVYCMKYLFDAVYRATREGEDQRMLARVDDDAPPLEEPVQNAQPIPEVAPAPLKPPPGDAR